MNFKQKIKNLKPKQLELLLKESQKVDAPHVHIPIDRSNAFFPLSFAQQRIWFQSQVNKSKTVYNNPLSLTVKLTSPLDVDQLEQVINRIIEKHEILRTTFHIHNGNPVQSITPYCKLKVIFQDCRDVPPVTRMKKAIELAQDAAKNPFDLETGPLIRFFVFQIDSTSYIFLKITHHIISDGWSNNLFFDELAKGLFRIEEKKIPNFQYLEFIFWEKNQIQKSSHLDKLLAFWKNYLGEQLPFTQLPQEGILDQQGISEKSQKIFKLANSLNQEVQKFSHSNRTTPFITLLSVFNTLLFRYTGDEELLIGLPHANRNRAEFQKTLGLFTNLIPLLVRIEKSTSFLTNLQNIDQLIKKVLAHGEIPFNLLVKHLNPDRNLGTNPLFQILFVYQNFPHAYKVEGVEIKPLPIDSGESQYHLTFIVEESPGQILINIKYRNDIFDPYFIDKFYEHFHNMLSSLIANPSQLVVKASLLSQCERDALVGMSEQIATNEIRKEDLFCSSFEKEVLRNPAHIAVDCLDSSLTYNELNQRANQLARHLRSSGLGCGERVAICLDRSESFIIALLGILKAGLTFIPMDSTHPLGRIQSLLKQSEASLLITRSDIFAKISSLHIHHICIDEIEEIRNQETKNPNFQVLEYNLAYIMFTSGSSGHPKGVCVEQQQIASYLKAIDYEIDDSTLETFGFSSTIAADMGYTNLFYPLSKGKRVVMIPKNIADDPNLLSRYLEKHPIDVLKYTPSQLTFLLKTKNREAVLPKNLLILAGEPLPYRLIKEVQDIRPSLRIMSSYGPTETTIGVMTNPIPKQNKEKRTILGKPNRNAQIYLLDENMEPVPFGVKGEIVIGGQGVSRGYFNDPELSSRFFVRNPFSKSKDRLLYKSGDIGRYLKDGRIEFIERKDRQIKLRGYRIELGEIESILNAITGVSKGVVIFDSRQSEKQIICFVSIERGLELDKSDIQKQLRFFLPDYMIPSQIILVDQFPLNLSGKIDFNQLKQRISYPEKKEIRPPRDYTEETLVKLWQDILKLEKVGINENFFDLGGHSFLALELIVKIDELFGIQIPLASFFEYRTIEDLARKLRNYTKELFHENPLVKMQTSKKSDPAFYLVHPAGGQILCYAELVKRIKIDLPFYGLQAPFLDIDKIDQHNSIEKIASIYLDSLQPKGIHKPIFGGWSSGGVIALEMAKQYGEKEGKFPLVIIIDYPAPNSMGEEHTFPSNNARYLERFIDQVEEFSNINIDLNYEQLKVKNEQDQFLMLYKQFIDKQLIPKEINPTSFENYLILQKTQSFALFHYQPSEYKGAVLLIRASSSKWTHVKTDSLGWESVAPKLTLKWVNGNHFSIVKAPDQVDQLAKIIAEWLKAYGTFPSH